MFRQDGRLYIDLETRELYSKVKNQFYNSRISNSEVFSLALATGYYYGIKEPLHKKTGFIRHETINYDLFSIILLLGIDEYGVNNEWVNNPLDLFDMAEEYANAGIKILMEIVEDNENDLEEFLTSTIFKLYDSIDFNLRI